jgi:hypothetical protein
VIYSGLGNGSARSESIELQQLLSILKLVNLNAWLSWQGMLPFAYEGTVTVNETVGNMQRVIKQLAGTRLNLVTTRVHGVMPSWAVT